MFGDMLGIFKVACLRVGSVRTMWWGRDRTGASSSDQTASELLTQREICLVQPARLGPHPSAGLIERTSLRCAGPPVDLDRDEDGVPNSPELTSCRPSPSGHAPFPQDQRRLYLPGPKMTAFQSMRLSAHGAPDTPKGGSEERRLKSRMRRRRQAVDCTPRIHTTAATTRQVRASTRRIH